MLLQQKLINAFDSLLETEKETATFEKKAGLVCPLLHSCSVVRDSNSPLKTFQAKQSHLCLRFHIQYQWASTLLRNMVGDQKILEVDLIYQTLSKDITGKVSNLKIRNLGFKDNCVSEYICQAPTLYDLGGVCTHVHRHTHTHRTRHLPYHFLAQICQTRKTATCPRSANQNVIDLEAVSCETLQ